MNTLNTHTHTQSDKFQMTAKQQQWQLQSTNLQNLPKDIIYQILSLLPAKSLLNLFPVSTTFPPLISSPYFLNLHLSSTASSCHHLILYYESTDYTHQKYSLLSPTSLRQILPLTRPFDSLHGYLRIVGSSKGVICFSDTNHYAFFGRVILWNPCINRFKGSEMFDCVMEFDMFDECFRVIELPEGRGVGYNQLHLSSSKDGELCLCFHFNDVGGERWELWEMGEYGVVESWRRMYNIVQPTISLPPLSIRGNGEVLFVINGGRLVLFDTNKEQIKDLQVEGLPSSFHMVEYTSSLALLNG